MSKHRRGDKFRGSGGSMPDPDKIRWRLEWNENGPQSEPFNSRRALDDRKAELEQRGIKCHVVNVR